MFPEPDMPGVDLVLPDFTYLRERADAVEGVVLTHAPRGPRRWARLPAARRRLPDLRLAALARAGPLPHRGGRDARPHAADPGPRRRAPTDRARSTSSSSRSPTRCPHAFAAAYHTPQGTILHSGDFKIDLTPVDGRRTDLARLGEIATPRPAAVAACCSRTARTPSAPASPPSESTVGAAMRTLFRDHEGKRIIVASFASHLHRVQQVAEAAIGDAVASVAFVGRSMIKNVTPGARDGPHRHPRRPRDRHRGGAELPAR